MSYDLSIAQDRRTAAQFRADNPTPEAGQLCIETDTNKAKEGDGSTVWTSLAYINLTGEQRVHADVAFSSMELADERDDTGGGGGGSAVSQGWKLTANVANSDPNDGTQINFSNIANVPASTTIGLGHNAGNGTATAVWAALANGGKLMIVDAANDAYLEFTVVSVEDVGTSHTVTVKDGLGSAPADGASCYVLAIPEADSHPDTIVVSGAGTDAANGTYRRGEGADAYSDGFAQWIKEGDPLWTVKYKGPNYSINNDGTEMYAAATADVQPWEGSWLESTGTAPAPTVSAGGGKVLDPRAVVVAGAGTAACNATYLQAGVYNGKPWYAKVGGTNSGDPATSDSIFSAEGDGLFKIAIADGTGLYGAANGGVVYPWLDTYGSLEGDNPAPTVTQGYTTPQALADQLAATKQDAIGVVNVSGAGTTACNGAYIEAGVYNGRPWYAKVGGTNSGDPTSSDAVYDIDGMGSWFLRSASTLLYSNSNGPINYPWLSEWLGVEDGDSPAPTVTQGTLADAILAAGLLP